jgi:hypothetical protein
LRKVAKTRMDAEAAKAKLEIQRASVERQEALQAGALQTDQAQAFLESMPTPEALMPQLTVEAIETERKGLRAVT